MPADRDVSILGLGNSFRGDDGVGIKVAENIGAERIDNVAIFTNIADSVSLIESWEGSDAAYIIDAVSSGSAPGKIHRFEPMKEEIPAGIFRDYSTHSLDLKKAVELAEILDRLPGSLVVYGIEGKNFSPGADLTPEVNEAVSEVCRKIVHEIHEHTGNRARK